MKTYSIAICCGILLTCQVFATPIPAPPSASAPAYAPGRLIVKIGPADASVMAASSSPSGRHGPAPRFAELQNKYKLSGMHKLFDDEQPRARSLQTAAATIAQEGVYLLELDQSSDVESAAREFRAATDVLYAHPDYIVHTFQTYTDPYLDSSGAWGQDFDDLWGLRQLHAQEAWNVSQGEGVVVAVVDTGIDYNHPDLAANVWINRGEDINHDGVVSAADFNAIDDDGNGYIDDLRGYNFTSCTDSDSGCTPSAADRLEPMDENGHGTHVAGTIAAVGRNGIGIAGIAPRAKVMAVKALDAAGEGTISSLAAGLRYAVKNHARVINCSWGMGPYLWPEVPLLEETLRDARDQGSVLIFAAGNGTRDTRFYSPQYLSDLVINVAATNVDGLRADFSNWGEGVEISAPGTQILSLSARHGSNSIAQRIFADPSYKFVRDRDYMQISGTSMAAPHVSGAVALLLARYPNLSIEDVRHALRSSASSYPTQGFESFIGYGILDAAKLMNYQEVLRPEIQTPAENAEINPAHTPHVAIKGEIAGGLPLGEYRLFYGRGWLPPSTWTEIGAGTRPMADGTLVEWDVSQLPPDSYTLRLVATSSGPTQARFYDDVKVAVVDPRVARLNLTSRKVEINEDGLSIGDGRVAWRENTPDGGFAVCYKELVQLEKPERCLRSTGAQYNPSIAGNWLLWTEARIKADASAPLPPLSYTSVMRLDMSNPSAMIQEVLPGTTGSVTYDQPVGNMQYLAARLVPFLGPQQIVVYPLAEGRPREVKVSAATSDLRLLGSTAYFFAQPRDFLTPYQPGDLWGVYSLDLSNVQATPQLVVGKDQFRGIGKFSTRYAGFVVNYDNNEDVALYEPNTQKLHRVTSGPARQNQPSTYDHRVAWVDWSDLQGRIFYCDFDAEVGSCKPRLLTDNTSSNTSPVLDGRWIAWQEYRHGLWRVLATELPETLPPVIDAPETIEVKAGERLEREFTASDPDGDRVTLSASANALPSAQVTQVSMNSVRLSWQPAASVAGNFVMDLTAKDAPYGRSTVRHVTIRVLPPAPVPQLILTGLTLGPTDAVVGRSSSVKATIKRLDGAEYPRKRAKLKVTLSSAGVNRIKTLSYNLTRVEKAVKAGFSIKKRGWYTVTVQLLLVNADQSEVEQARHEYMYYVRSRKNVAISGTTTTTSGAPLAGVQVRIGSSRHSVVSNALGKFSVTKLSPGTYTVSMSKNGVSAQTVLSITHSDTTVTLAWTPGTPIAVALTEPGALTGDNPIEVPKEAR